MAQVTLVIALSCFSRSGGAIAVADEVPQAVGALPRESLGGKDL